MLCHLIAEMLGDAVALGDLLRRIKCALPSNCRDVLGHLHGRRVSKCALPSNCRDWNICGRAGRAFVVLMCALPFNCRDTEPLVSTAPSKIVSKCALPFRCRDTVNDLSTFCGYIISKCALPSNCRDLGGVLLNFIFAGYQNVLCHLIAEILVTL